MAGRVPDERGETLIELIVTVFVLGVTAVAVLGGLFTSITVSDVHRKQATAGTLVQAYAESVQRSVTAGGYTACAGPGAFPAAPSAPGYSGAVTGVRYWVAATRTWGSACTAATDAGLQQLTMRVSSADGRDSETSVVVVRKPCGQGATC